MRKLIILSILAVALASCSNVAQYKEAIESLSTDWESTTEKVSGVVDQINQVQAQGKSALQSMTPSEEVAANLTEEQTQKLNTLQQTVQSQVGNLGALAQKAFEFVSKWQEEGEKLTALKDGLSSGKLPGDVQGTIDNLQGLVGAANENVTDWTSQVDSAKAAIDSAKQSYSAMMAQASE